MPVAIDPCTLDALTAKSGCFNCLSQSEKYAAMLYLMGTTVVSADPALATITNIAEARKLVACFTCEPESVLDSFLVSIWMDEAVNLGALPKALTIAELRNAIKCAGCGIGRKEMKAMEVFLLCRMLNISQEAPCWVAREVYGVADPRWRIFRSWLMGPAPGWLRALYTGYGQQFARWLADKPRVKRVVRYFMDKVINRIR